MKRLTIILLFFASVLQGQTGAGFWHGSQETGAGPAGPDTLTLTYWDDFILLHIANTGITEDANGVSEWQDRSGNGNHSTQTVNTNKPSTDGSGNVVFDGNDYLTMSSYFLSAYTEMTIFVVGEVESNTDDNIRYFFDYNDRTDDQYIRLNIDTLVGNQFKISSFASNQGGFNIDTINYNTTFVSVQALKENDYNTFYINGSVVDSVSTSIFSDAGFAGGRKIGAFSTGGGDYLRGKIYFMGITNRKFSTSEVATTQSELNSFFTIY